MTTTDHETETLQELREAIARVQREPTPQTPEQQEAFFQECVAEGEKLAVMGGSLLISRSVA